jgi:hypothetical protein
MLRIAAASLVALAVGSAVTAAPAKRIAAILKTNASGVTAGRPWTATISIRAGQRPFSGRATLLATGQIGPRTFTTRRARPGLFRARIVFPGGGRWTLSVRAAGRTARLASLDVRGAGPRISRPHGLEIAEEHGDLIVPDLDGTSFFEVNLRTLARTVVGRGFDHPLFLNFGPGGYLYVADATRIYRFEPDGSKTPIAGNGRRARQATAAWRLPRSSAGRAISPSTQLATSTSPSTTTASASSRLTAASTRSPGSAERGTPATAGRHATRRSARRTVWTSCPMGPCWSRTATTASSGESTAPPGS